MLRRLGGVRVKGFIPTSRSERPFLRCRPAAAAALILLAGMGCRTQPKPVLSPPRPWVAERPAVATPKPPAQASDPALPYLSTCANCGVTFVTEEGKRPDGSYACGACQAVVTVTAPSPAPGPSTAEQPLAAEPPAEPPVRREEPVEALPKPAAPSSPSPESPKAVVRVPENPPPAEKGLLGQYTQHDPVTGAPVINRYSLAQEVEWARTAEAGLIEQEKKDGFAVDQDPAAVGRIGRIFGALTQVSHLPKIPWKVHYTSRPLWNAGAYPGGLVLVYKQLLDDTTDDELAAVLGHELAHVTCRHGTERLTHAQVASLASETARTALYSASYSTENEAEADRVGLLYTSLAGYDPRAAHRMWARRHLKEGSNPGRYLFTHPLNKDRAEMTRRLGETAAKYFAGPGVVHPKAAEILARNELAPRIGSTGDETVDFLSAALLEHLKFRQTKEEAGRREEALKATQDRKAAALRFVRVAQVKPGNTTTGKPGIFAVVQNGSNMLMKRVSLQFYFKSTKGTWEPYLAPLVLGNLKVGESRTWGIEFQAPGQNRWQYSASIVDVDY